jgi:hypothetical protein
LKKIERLRWLQATFGRDAVLPYETCVTWEEILAAIRRFERAGCTWGMRTDTVNGQTQGYSLPFVLHGSLEEARGIWDEHGTEFVYIVSQNILRYDLNGVAVSIDPEHALVEINDVDRDVSQRGMYIPGHTRAFGLGPSRGIVIENAIFVRCVDPESWYARDRRLDRVYEFLRWTPGIEELTFSVRAGDRRLVLW